MPSVHFSFTTNILSPLRRDHRKERGEKNCGTLSILSSGYPYSLILSEQFPFGRFTSPLRQMPAPSLSLSHPNTLGSRIQYLRSCLQVQGIFLPGSSNNYVLRPIPIHCTCTYRINRVWWRSGADRHNEQRKQTLFIIWLLLIHEADILSCCRPPRVVDETRPRTLLTSGAMRTARMFVPHVPQIHSRALVLERAKECDKRKIALQ